MSRSFKGLVLSRAERKRREWNGERTLLYIGQADVIAVDAAPGAQLWTQALGLGMNELHVCLCSGERIDRLQLQARIVRRLAPILNLIGHDTPTPEAGQRLNSISPLHCPTSPARRGR
jgi:hypothetical protein